MSAAIPLADANHKMNLDERRALRDSCDPHDEAKLARLDEDFLGNAKGVNALADRLPPSQPTPTEPLLGSDLLLIAKHSVRIGDRYISTVDIGNPFSCLGAEVMALQNGFVQYFFTNNPYSRQFPASARLMDFLDRYTPTEDTIAARTQGISLADWLAYVADQKQAAEDEAREVALNDQNERDRLAHEEAQHEVPL